MSAIFCTSVSQGSQVPFMVADFRGSAAVRNPQDKIGGLIKRVKFYSTGNSKGIQEQKWISPASTICITKHLICCPVNKFFTSH